MFEKNMRLACLLDFYGEALDERTRDILTAYYEDDLSLAEIAMDESISRQGVRHIIKKGEDYLEFLENALMLMAHYKELTGAADELQKIKDKLMNEDGEKYREEIASLSKIISVILSKGI